MANKRKTTTAIVAGVTALALLLGGTFAWTSISQQARNEAIVDINPGGRLHDDFNGTNKDVYVENFGDKTTGVPIFARVRLDQYFEVGQEAGKNKEADNRNVKPLIGTDIDDVTTWVTYKPTTETWLGDSKIAASDNWTWTMGNGEDNKPYYMPTFNKNKDSLAADINGTYEGTKEGDIVHYDDYIFYDADSEPVIKDATYDWDEDTDEDYVTSTRDENAPIDSADVLLKEETHTATQITKTAQVILMSEWNGQPGPYWVYDTDGWAYWAQPIAPGETTGLLLDGINMSKVPDDNYYYGINVVGQFATKGDIYRFEDMSPDAEELFVTVSGSEDSVAITGADTVFPGRPTAYTATRMVLGGTAVSQPDFSWTATAADGTAIDGVTMDNGTLTVADTVAENTEITVTATAGDAAALAEGETTALTGSKVVIVKYIPELTYSLTDAGETKAENAKVEGGTVRYEMANDADEVISIKLNRNIDINSILADEDTIISGVDTYDTPVDYATLDLVDGDSANTLNITLKGARIYDTITVDGIERPLIRLAVTTEYGERIIVELLVELTEAPSMTLNGSSATDEITLQPGTVFAYQPGKDLFFNGWYYAYFFDNDDRLLTDYSLDYDTPPTVQFADTVTETKTVKLVVTAVASGSDNKLYYTTFDNVKMVP